VGWMAIATRADGTDLIRRASGRLSGHEAEEFGSAAASIAAADPLLPAGALGRVHSGIWLEMISGYLVYQRRPWPFGKVMRAAARVKPFDSYGVLAVEDQRPDYESAATFLRICADLGLGIRFSW
jgi:hypothetical protein